MSAPATAIPRSVLTAGRTTTGRRDDASGVSVAASSGPSAGLASGKFEVTGDDPPARPSNDTNKPQLVQSGTQAQIEAKNRMAAS
jgi:hypothetical protein